jgi:hypothetical protein
MVFIPFSATRHVGMGSPLVHEGSWLGTSRRPSSRSITAAGTGDDRRWPMAILSGVRVIVPARSGRFVG